MTCVCVDFFFFSRCVSNQRPLLDSGTMGTKGHTEIIVPNLTESYNSHVSMRWFVVYTTWTVSFAHKCVIFFDLERPPRRRDPVLHTKVFPFCHRAHHSVGERQSEWWSPAEVCILWSSVSLLTVMSWLDLVWERICPQALHVQLLLAEPSFSWSGATGETYILSSHFIDACWLVIQANFVHV